MVSISGAVGLKISLCKGRPKREFAPDHLFIYFTMQHRYFLGPYYVALRIDSLLLWWGTWSSSRLWRQEERMKYLLLQPMMGSPGGTKG